MGKPPRRDLEELYSKYDLHPNVIDIYVEGDFDFDFFNHFIGEAEIPGVCVFHIDDVEIPAHLAESHGFNHGSNKHRVLTLARMLDLRYGERPTNVACLVDADCDRVLQRSYGLRHALLTDYSCVESYLVIQPTLTRFLTFACRMGDESPVEFMHIAKLVLPTQFALRATCEVLQLNVSVLGFDSGLKTKRNFLSFDSQKYINAFLAAHALQKRRNEICATFDDILAKLPADFRHAIQGHDFVTLLFEFLWSRGGLKLQDKIASAQEFGGRLVALACRSADLIEEPLFARMRGSSMGDSMLVA